jgi:transcriptional regulator with XRE-family HTH domain
MYFRSYLPHCHRSASKEAARTLNLMYSLRGAIDSDDGELGPTGHQFYRRGVHHDLVKEAAEKIAILRRARGLTLADLARSVGIPMRHLRQIEQGDKPVSLEVLLRLARKFRRPIEYFLAGTIEDRPSHFVQRRNQIKDAPARMRRPRGDSGSSRRYEFRPLASGFPDRGMHPYYVQVTVSQGAAVPAEHHGQEFIYVLDGEVEFVTLVGGHDHSEVLGAGDAIFLESSVPHCLRGRSHNPYADICAEIINVFWSPLGEEYLFESQDARIAVDVTR